MHQQNGSTIHWAFDTIIDIVLLVVIVVPRKAFVVASGFGHDNDFFIVNGCGLNNGSARSGWCAVSSSLLRDDGMIIVGMKGIRQGKGKEAKEE